MNNKFLQNFGYYSTTAVFIRRYDPNYLSYNFDKDYVPCANINLNGNIFSNNFGCPLYGGGVFTIECLNSYKESIMDLGNPLDMGIL